MTPPFSRAEIHWDEMDSIIVQLQGEKSWRVWDPLVEWPLAHQRIKPNSREIGVPTMEVTMRPCDVLYLPRGWIHAAHTTAGPDSSPRDSLHVTLGVFNHLLSFSHAFTDIIQAFTADAHQRYAAAGGAEVPALIVSIDHFLGGSFPREPLLSCGDLMLAMAAAYANGTSSSTDYDAVASRRTMYTTPATMDALGSSPAGVAAALRAEMRTFIGWATDDTAAALRESMGYVYYNQPEIRDQAINRHHAGSVDPLLKSPAAPQLLEWARRLVLHAGGRGAVSKLAKPLRQSFRELRAAIDAGAEPDLVLAALQHRQHRQHANVQGRAAAMLAALALHTDDTAEDEL